MNFLLIDQTLRTVLNAISGLPIGTAQGADQSQYFPQVGSGAVTDGHGNDRGTGTNRQASLDYQIVSVMGLGWDEWRERYDAAVLQPGDTYVDPDAPLVPLGSAIVENTGNRELHVQIICECFDASDGAGPVPIVERIRTAIKLPSVIEMLNTAGLAVQGCKDTITTHYEDDNNRKVNVAVLEIIFNAADGIEDVPTTTIEIIERPALTVYGLVTDAP